MPCNDLDGPGDDPMIPGWARAAPVRQTEQRRASWARRSIQARLSRKSATTAVCCRILQRPADVSALPTLIPRTAEADGVTSASSLGISPTPSTYATASGECSSALPVRFRGLRPLSVVIHGSPAHVQVWEYRVDRQ